MLYLIPTPIGNLSDASLRSIELLQDLDYILCEDTRHSAILMAKYKVNTPLLSFHKFNEAQREESVIEDLRQGKSMGVVSDAGTPGIADPAQKLVARCHQEGLKVSALPGPCAAISALVSSGLSTERFQFLGFLPKKVGERELAFKQALAYRGTTIFYESPKRLVSSLELLATLHDSARCAVARELTKQFEEVAQGSVGELLMKWESQPVRGECVLLIEGREELFCWEGLSYKEHVELVERVLGIKKKEAMKVVADERGVTKREVYQALLV